MSGAGRIVTRRSDSARRRRLATRGLRIQARSQLADLPATPPGDRRVAANTSGSARSPVDREPVLEREARGLTGDHGARHSVTRPARHADQVWGLAWTILARPRCCRPRCGDSRRASATMEADPLTTPVGRDAGALRGRRRPRRRPPPPAPSAQRSPCRRAPPAPGWRRAGPPSSRPLGPSRATCTSRRIAATAAAVRRAWVVVMDPLHTKGPTLTWLGCGGWWRRPRLWTIHGYGARRRPIGGLVSRPPFHTHRCCIDAGGYSQDFLTAGNCAVMCRFETSLRSALTPRSKPSLRSVLPVLPFAE